MQGARSQKQFRDSGIYGSYADVPQGVNTQEGIRQQNLYSHLYKAVGTQQGLGAADYSHGPTDTRSPSGLMSHGMYKHLYHAANPPKKGLINGLAGYLGQAVSATAPGVMLVVVIVVIYYLFFSKKAESVKKEESVTETPTEVETSTPLGEENLNFYY